MADGSDKVVIYTDGGARGNPGPAAFGVVIKLGSTVKRYGETLGIRTNNEAEYEGVIFALKKAKQLFGAARLKQIGVEVRMDSQLAVEQLSGRYKIENERLQPLFMKIWNIQVEIGRVHFMHIPREDNKEADKMVNQALDRESQGNLFEK